MGRVMKKGKMSWAPRMCGIKNTHVEVFKLKEPTPTNSIPLHGCSVASDKTQPQLTLVASDRKYVFKCQSIAERDTIASLMRKAIDDGNSNAFLALSCLALLCLAASAAATSSLYW
jgi:hypothetical protein